MLASLRLSRVTSRSVLWMAAIEWLLSMFNSCKCSGASLWACRPVDWQHRRPSPAACAPFQPGEKDCRLWLRDHSDTRVSDSADTQKPCRRTAARHVACNMDTATRHAGRRRCKVSSRSLPGNSYPSRCWRHADRSVSPAPDLGIVIT